ncbi:MFS transporter [bacterium]|nr:MFS transporter [bacterium]
MNPKRKTLVVSAFLLMLASAFTDNLRASLIPLLHNELGMSFAHTGGLLLTVAGVAGALFNTQLLRIEDHQGIRGIVFFAASLMLLTAVLAIQVSGAATLALMSIPLGGAITSLGTVSNLLMVMGSETGETPDRAHDTSTTTLDARSARRAKMLAGLHLMYGAGALTAPAIAGLAFAKNLAWPWIFSVPLTLIAMPAIWSLRLGPGKQTSATRLKNGETSARLPLWRGMSPAEWFVVAIFLAYVTGEVLASMWMPSFLMDHFKLDFEHANKTSAGFFLTFSVARLLVVIFMRERFHKPLVYFPLILGACLMITGIVLSQPGKSSSGLVFLFPLAGIIGPFFPMMLARVSTLYHESWQRLTVVILTTMQVALALSHVILGAVFDELGAQRAYLIPPALLIIAGCGSFAFLKRSRASSG